MCALEGGGVHISQGNAKVGQSAQKLSLEMLRAKLSKFQSPKSCSRYCTEDWSSFPVSILGPKWQIQISELIICLCTYPCVNG